MNGEWTGEFVSQKQTNTFGKQTSRDLHEVSCELGVTFPELAEGEVHAGVVHQLPGDSQRVSLRNAVSQQALAENYHDAFPVTARHLEFGMEYFIFRDIWGQILDHQVNENQTVE